MKFMLLGTLRAERDGAPVDLGPRQQRCLLAVLLLNANRVVSTERILESLWGDDSDGKENALWVYVSRLRGILDPDRAAQDAQMLTTEGRGYVINVDPDAVDVKLFERLAGEGANDVRNDPVAAESTLSEALSLWDGMFLEDFLHDEFSQSVRHRLDELRLVATEDRTEARLRLGQSGELVGELETTHAEHPHRERLLTQLMLALYRSGRQAEALRSFERYRRGLAEDLGLEPSPELRRLEEQILLHDPRLQRRGRSAAATARTRVDTQNPFKGLRFFGETDGEHFFGRDRLISDVLRRITEGERLITLVGASGSGKSSVVRAGLIPALRKGAVDGSENWLIAQMVPGAHPMAELEAALLRSTIDAPDSLSDQLADGDLGLMRAALRVLPTDDSRLLLVIDQFEELFTIVESEERRARFLANFAAALDDPRGRIVVVLTLRADFYDRPLAYPDFGTRLANGVVNVVPLIPNELEAAASEPANQANVSLEPALLATLVADVIGQPGGLPLFQYALTELFERRETDTLTLESYESMGGVRGALSKRADDLYLALEPSQQAVIKQIMLRLVTIADNGQTVRRRVAARELVGLEGAVVEAQTVIDLYGSHRLLSFDLDSVTGDPTLEVAHEALLTEWPRLKTWIDEARDDLRRHVALMTAMGEWEETDRSPDYLLSGTRLDDYVAWAASSLLHLSGPELDFLERSTTRSDEKGSAESDRLEQQQTQSRRASRRSAALALALASVLLAIVGFILFTGDDELPTVGFVSVDPNFSGVINDQVVNGIEEATRRFDIDAEHLVPQSDAAGEITALLESEPDLVVFGSGNFPIFGTGGLVIGPSDLVDAYPNTQFAFADILLEDPESTDLSVAVFAPEESSFLVGAAAALTTSTHKIGFIGATPVVIDVFQAGFEAGARHVDPDIEIVTHTLVAPMSRVFASFGLGESVARSLYGQGVDVIYTAAGDTGLATADVAASNTDPLGPRLWAIGVDVDMWLQSSAEVREHVLTSALKRHDSAIIAMVDQFLDGELVPGAVRLDLSNDGVGYTTSGGHMSASTIEVLESLRQEIIDGNIIIPTTVSASPTDHPIPDSTISVIFDGTTCTADTTGSLQSGEVAEVEIKNNSEVDLDFNLFVERVGGGDILTGAALAPNSSRSLYVQIVGVGVIEPVCFHGDTAAAAQTFVIALRGVTRDLRVDFDGVTCRTEFAGVFSVGSLIRFEFHNNSDEMAGMGAAPVEPGTGVALLEETPLDMWPFIGDGTDSVLTFDLAPGEVTQVNVVPATPGTWVFNCIADRTRPIISVFEVVE